MIEYVVDFFCLTLWLQITIIGNEYVFEPPPYSTWTTSMACVMNQFKIIIELYLANPSNSVVPQCKA